MSHDVNSESRPLSLSRRHREMVQQGAAQRNARMLVQTCADLNPLDAFQLLLGACFAAGSEYERARTAEAVKQATKRLMDEGFHVEAASVLVSNCLKPEALAAIEVGLQVHLENPEILETIELGLQSLLEDTPDNKIVLRLVDLRDEANKL